MPLARPDPPLPRAQVSRPVTAQAWNQIIDSVDSLYDAAAVVDREYVQVNVTFRGGPVPGARVVAVPGPDGPPGPAVEGVGDGGDGTGFQLKRLGAGTWIVHVDAPGFAPSAQRVTVPSKLTGGAVSTVTAELTQTHVFVPDVVGFSGEIAGLYTVWANFRWGPDTPGVDVHSPRVVLAQGPAPETRVPIQLVATPVVLQRPDGNMAQLTTFLTQTDASRPGSVPWRTIVPDLVGLLKESLPGWFSLPDTRLVLGRQTVLSGAADPLRVVTQLPSAGEIVPAGTAIDFTLDNADPRKMRFGEFAGTHRKLADTSLQTIGDVLWPLFNSGQRPWYQYTWRPWAVARLYLTAFEVQAITELFATLGAPIGDAPGEGLAAAWASLHLGLIVMFEGRST